MFTIFERIFAPRCPPRLSHIGEPGTVALSSVCYMWWDILATSVGPQDPGKAEIDAAILTTLARTLALPSIACQEAALHGWGHSMRGEMSSPIELIDAYLRHETALQPELARYARAARAGCVQ